MPGSLQAVMQRDDTKQSLQDIIFGTKTQVSFALDAFNEEAQYPSLIKGITTGGNMYCFEKLLGTKYSPNLNSSIIVLEEIEEPPRKVDGFLQKLKLAPDFSGVKALVIGTFTPSENKVIFDKDSISSHPELEDRIAYLKKNFF